MTDDDRSLQSLAARLGARLVTTGGMAACAESCTGGWIAKVLTDVAGSSAWFDRGLVTYSNQAKQELLGVPEAVLVEQGAVSEPVVRQMAEGLLARSSASLTVAVSGVAGPGGGSDDKPVGTVWLAWAAADRETRAERHRFTGDRESVRRQSVARALQGMLELLD